MLIHRSSIGQTRSVLAEYVHRLAGFAVLLPLLRWRWNLSQKEMRYLKNGKEEYCDQTKSDIKY
jgi:hypothetical protein